MSEKKAKRLAAGRNTRFKPGNATRFRPGASGNPGGRPKLSGAYRSWLARPCRSRRHLRVYAELTGQRIDRRNPPTNAEVIAARAVHSAIAGKDAVRYAREIREATEDSQPAALGLAGAEEGHGGAGADAPAT